VHAPFGEEERPLAIQLQSIDDLTRPAGLSSLLGPVRMVERSPLGELGFSGARHERLTVRLGSGDEVRLVLKRVRPAFDWTAYRTGDLVGREALLLGEPAFQGVWKIFSCPYVAYAVEEGEVGLLMEDLGDYLRPNVAQPLTVDEEDAFLRSLAALHARYWNAEALNLPWLAAPLRRFAILGPGAPSEELQRSAPHPLFREVSRGWEIALRRLPREIRALILHGPEEIAAAYAHLPATLLHGDAKIGNVAFVPDGRLAIFDWAGMGIGPATLDLGYYLAVNSARLARSKEEVMVIYRAMLSRELGRPIAGPLWDELAAVAVLGGALMLLWSKALSLEAGAVGSEEEWSWWVSRLSLIGLDS
jgi:hypothetical protein